MNKTALIFGCTGMDGSHLSDMLLDKGYSVIGIKRRSSTNNLGNLSYSLTKPDFKLIEGEITDPSSMNNIISRYKPDECYLMAAMSHVGTSFEEPAHTFQVNTIGPLYILEAIRLYSPKTRLLQASTSEMFGNNYNEEVKGTFIGMQENANCFGYDDDYRVEKYQDENTSLSPNSPYAIAKTAAHHLIRMYRDAYNIHCSAAISFNHEGERRGENFVTRKITKYIAGLHSWMKKVGVTYEWLVTASDNEICCAGREEAGVGLEFPKLKLGNIDAVRDWGYSPDFCEAFYTILQCDTPDDYVVCTGEEHSIREFLDEAFLFIGISDWSKFVQIDKDLYRPNEVPYLKGNCDKIKKKLGWEPKTKFEELVKKMLYNDISNTIDKR